MSGQFFEVPISNRGDTRVDPHAAQTNWNKAVLHQDHPVALAQEWFGIMTI
jgi:hypothetical protein